ncbi:hypothetical protein K3718_13865 [Leisingera aquaemixtae]|uniref:Uncharacterized protein n=1 Tax=Leisingera aquaemixtae TaxID=1396826 RepID=A0ABY5WGN8_9RHOB|nr:hypothetical protein [Leisingera aquaemixtae]UWQ40632.1 hypothetical protein K3718_13865 [Leisingera aquaemixtae]
MVNAGAVRIVSAVAVRRLYPGRAAANFPAFPGGFRVAAIAARVFVALQVLYLPWLSSNKRGIRELLTLPQSVHETGSSWHLLASFQPHA